MCRDSVTQSISPEDVPTETLDLLEDPEFRYEEGTEDVHKYARLDRRLSDLEEDLGDVEAPEGVKNLYGDTIDEARSLLNIAKTIKNPSTDVKGNEVVPEASSEIYGKPSESTISWAEKILEETDPTEDARFTEEKYSTGEMVQTLEDTLKEIGMQEWNVATRDKGSVKVNAADQEIKVPEGREFTENETMRLLVHEVGSHALRGGNGVEQKYEVLGAGAGGYHATGEGVALYLEQETGLSNPNTMRKYAARVKSVQSVLDGDDFSETYKMNREHGFDHDKAWSMSRRAHRGGGFIKDHIYAEGKRMVEAYVKDEEELEDTSGIEKYAEMDGNLEDLLVGKVSVDQARKLSEMKSEYRSEDGESGYTPKDIVDNMGKVTPPRVDASVDDQNVDYGNKDVAGA
ncbi:MAG: uncharacterized protein conserved in bacteria [Candidatus Nanosalina sp. J07AB43]|nr:MAG: uncharacterized protein conserved in bacteria [Candidatus Nanosalina sp. J07AB43]